MRIQVHDFSGHPFQAQLARKLADRGHIVDHVHSSGYVSGKGRLSVEEGDSPTLSFSTVDLQVELRKYATVNRALWEIAYARAWRRRLQAEPTPDVVIACNLPLLSLFWFSRWARQASVPWLYWHQDVYYLGMAAELQRRFPAVVASPGTWVLERLERACARTAAHVVAIGDAFVPFYRRWGLPDSKVSVIANWAPLDEIVPADRDSAETAGLYAEGDLRLLYAGTLGRKHNPHLLLDLLATARELHPGTVLTVVSEGEASDDLAASGQPGLAVQPFQPSENLSAVLGSADVLVALLEPEATGFSIPSKVLSYLSAGRPIIGLMPHDNPAADDIGSCGGFIAEPTPGGARSAAAWLAKVADQSGRLTTIGKEARALAERKFDVDDVTDRFEDILNSVVERA